MDYVRTPTYNHIHKERQCTIHIHVSVHTQPHMRWLKNVESCESHKTCLTHCNTLQHTATHCNTLQHTASHCNAMLDPASPIRLA